MRLSLPPSGRVFVEIPDTGFDDIGGLDDIKDKIIRSIVWPQQYRELYGIFGCTAPRGILFYGAPGTGKTLCAKAIASLNNSKSSYLVKGPELLSKWGGRIGKSPPGDLQKGKAGVSVRHIF